MKNLINNCGMDLPKGSQHEMFRAKLLQEEFLIFLRSRARLARCEPRVQPLREAGPDSPAGAECMDQPRITGHQRVLNPGQTAPRKGLIFFTQRPNIA